jgi:hypothetical protein
MSFGDSGRVLQHEGEERKVRAMATWLKGLRGRRSPKGGKDGDGSDKLGGGGGAPVG